MKPHLFAIASRDEIWVRGSLVQQRIEHGDARFQDGAIVARDRLDRELRERCDALLDSHVHIARENDDCRIRLVVSSRRVEGFDADEASISISKGHLSVVTEPEHAASVLKLLRARTDGAPASAGQTPPAKAGAPYLWLNGSASILLHEAAGHASEHGAAPLEWPAWLSVRDVPRVSHDDVGYETKPADLLTSELPASFRRESFRDVPLQRMADVVVEQRDAPYELPDARIEIHLVEGGSYDPLTEMVTLRVAAADLVEKSRSRRLAPFDIVRSRASIAAAVIGASGDPIRYPGVVCSREGQELLVGSQAPVMVTLFHD